MGRCFGGLAYWHVVGRAGREKSKVMARYLVGFVKDFNTLHAVSPVDFKGFSLVIGSEECGSEKQKQFYF